jgi:hypothetical protein
MWNGVVVDFRVSVLLPQVSRYAYRNVIALDPIGPATARELRRMSVRHRY